MASLDRASVYISWDDTSRVRDGEGYRHTGAGERVNLLDMEMSSKERKKKEDEEMEGGVGSNG